MKFTVRSATESDVPALLEMIRELASFEKLSHQVSADTEILRDSLFRRRAAEALLGEIDGNPVAFAIFFHNFSTFLGKPGLYLEDLFVKPMYRGRGYGDRMLKEVAKIAFDRDCGRLEWAVLDWNENAIRFYKRLGAQPMSDWGIFRLNQTEIQSLARTC